MIEKALIEAGIEYERVPGSVRRGKREVVVARTGQALYPAIQFDNGTWYREESSEMARTIAEGRLMDRRHPERSRSGAWVAIDGRQPA